MKNALTALVGILMLVVFGFYVTMTYQDQVRVFPKKEPQIMESSVSIEEKAYLSVLEGLKMPIENVTWIDEDTVRFEAATEGLYEYRLSTKALTTKEKLQTSSVTNLAGGGTLSYDEAGYLIYSLGDAVTLIDPNLTRESEHLWVLAPDQKKIIFVDQASGKLKVFLFSKRKQFTSSEPTAVLAQERLKDAIGFSPDAGYFYIVTSRELLEGASFSVYGADSVKAYAKDIMGFSPVWAPGKSLKLAYHYTESLEKLSPMPSVDISYIPDKVGVFDIRTKKASYLTLPEDGNFFGPMIWRDGELLSTLSDGSDKIVGLYRYGVQEKKGILKAFETPILMSDIQSIQANSSDAKVVFLYETEKESLAITLQGVEAVIINPVQGFDLNGELTGVCFTPYGLMYYTGHKLYLQTIAEFKVLLEAEKADFKMMSSPLGNRFFIQITLSGDTHILVLNLDEL
jgi:hypothetical protein